MQIRRSDERGTAHHGWLDSAHTFSFADYHDPAHMGFRSLRVINEDRVAGGRGFGAHPHRDMEIVSVVLDGELEHRDSMGNGSVLRPGDVQRMSAGTGVVHSEFNRSATEPLHFLQIWILPDRRGLPPSYAERHFAEEERRDRFRLLVSPDGREGSITIHQDARLWGAVLGAGVQARLPVAEDRHGWIQVVRGEIETEGHELTAGDGASFAGARAPSLRVKGEAEVLVFDLA